jgi:hypothetical protein
MKFDDAAWHGSEDRWQLAFTSVKSTCEINEGEKWTYARGRIQEVLEFKVEKWTYARGQS